MRKRSKYRPKGVRLDTIGYVMERALEFANTQFVNKRMTVLPKLEGVPT